MPPQQKGDVLISPDKRSNREDFTTELKIVVGISVKLDLNPKRVILKSKTPTLSAASKTVKGALRIEPGIKDLSSNPRILKLASGERKCQAQILVAPQGYNWDQVLIPDHRNNCCDEPLQVPSVPGEKGKLYTPAICYFCLFANQLASQACCGKKPTHGDVR